MRTSATTFKRAAMIAIAGAIVSTMATASWAQPARSHRAPAAASDEYNPAAPYFSHPSSQCTSDEGYGRYSTCDAAG